MALFNKKKPAKKKSIKKESTVKKAKKSSDEIIKEKVSDGWIHVRVIVEMLGAPKEHIEKSFQDLLQVMKEDRELKIVSEKTSKPEQQKELWAVFTELDVLFPDVSKMVFFCFDYMPSSIEIVEPEVFHYRAKDFTDFFNDLQMKLHKMDYMLKNLNAENKNLQRNANLLLRNSVIITLTNQGKLGIKDLSKKVGIPDKQLSPFLEELIKQKYIIKKKELYSVE